MCIDKNPCTLDSGIALNNTDSIITKHIKLILEHDHIDIQCLVNIITFSTVLFINVYQCY